MDEIISSGQLRIIRDDQLRTALAAWPADVEHYRRRESWAQDNWNFLVAPFITRTFSLGQLATGILGEIPGEDAHTLRRLRERNEEILRLLAGTLDR